MPWEVPAEGVPGAHAPTWVPLSSMGPCTAPSSTAPFYSLCPGGCPADRKHQLEGRKGNKGRDSGQGEEFPLSSVCSLCPL